MTVTRIITGNMYLGIIMDAFSLKIISWKINPRMPSQFIVELISNALSKRKKSSNLILHTDRGSQYTSHVVRQFLDHNQINHSFSKIGYPWDNAITESFFKYAKKEEFDRRKFHNISEVKKSAFSYIEGFYNTRRPHSETNLCLQIKEHQNLTLNNNQKIVYFIDNDPTRY